MEYANGTCSISGDLTRKAKEWGLVNRKTNSPLSASQIHLLLQNPFYYGEMKVKGKIYQHKYEPLITKELFDKCQQVRLGNNRTQQPKATEKPFVFRGFLKCAVSGRRVSCDLKKGKFVYLICRDPENPEKKLFIPENQILEQVKEVFKSLQVPESLLAALTEHLKSGHEAEIDFHKQAVLHLQKEYRDITEKLNVLLEMRLDKSITKDEYDKKTQELKERQLEINVMSSNHEKGDDSFRITV